MKRKAPNQKSILAHSPKSSDVSARELVRTITCKSGVTWHHGGWPNVEEEFHALQIAQEEWPRSELFELIAAAEIRPRWAAA